MTWLDYAVLGVLGVSILWGAWRGLIREVVAVVGWVLAFVAANALVWPLYNVLPEEVATAELRFLFAFLAILVAALFAAALVGMIVSRGVRRAGLGGLDRTLGSVFGVARGMLIVLVFGLFAGLTALPRQPLWRDSLTGEPLTRVAEALKPWLPRTFADRLRYH